MKVSKEEYERLDFEDFVEKLKPQYDTLCSLEDMKMLTESIGKLVKEDDPLFHVLQNIADGNAEMENKLVNADGSIN